MQTKSLGLLFVLAVWVSMGQAPHDSLSPAWKKEAIDTTTNAEYLTAVEREVILEINKARTDPPEYARRDLIPMRAYYHHALLKYPGEPVTSTVEGLPALDECIRALQAAKPSPPLSPRKGLTLSARDQAKDQGKTGATGHSGSDQSTMESRLARYGKWGGYAGENIDYGNGDAKRIVASMLIDDGVPSRGHRKNLLDTNFKVVGVAVGPHPVYRHMCVMDFASSYE